jgi:mono/diheme cytochrome c family protein
LVNTWSGALLGGENHNAVDGSLARGQALAAVHCAECHAIGSEDQSPTSVNANTPFRRLSERFPIAMLVEAAQTGSISGHDEMPGFDFTMDEIRDLLAFIDSYASADKHYLPSRHD